MQMLDERGVVACGILVEQPAQIGLGHRRRGFAGAEPRQLQARPVIVLRIGVAGLREGSHRAVAVAEPVADGAEREPGGGKARCNRDGLRQHVGRGGKIAARRKLDRRFIAAVGDKIAGGDEERTGSGHSDSHSSIEDIFILWHD